MNEFLILIIGLAVTSIIYFIFSLKNKTFELKEIKRAGYFEIKSKELPMKITYKDDYRYAEPWSVTKITCFRGKIYDGELTDEEKEQIKESTRKRKRPAKPVQPEAPATNTELPTPPPITGEEATPVKPTFTFPGQPTTPPEEKEDKPGGDIDTEWSFGRSLK